MNIINSAAYEDLCDHRILYIDDMNRYMTTFELYKKDCIIYCKTDFTEILFKHLQFSKRKYVLVTHHSDYSITEQWFRLKPKNVLKWFAINVAYVHPDLIRIPLGIWTSEGRAYYQSIHKIAWFKENFMSLREVHKITDKVYCNWGDTNPERKNVIKKLEGNVKYDWVKDPMDFMTYCKKMAEYKFVISPPGNGTECHRTWEALYMGCVPIVIKNYIYNAFEGLPIIQVKDYSEVNIDMLWKYLDNCHSNLEKLYIEYWEKQIKEALK